MFSRKKAIVISIIAIILIVVCAVVYTSCSHLYEVDIADALARRYGGGRGNPKLNPLVGKQVCLVGKAVSHQKWFAWIEVDKGIMVQVSNQSKWPEELEGRQVRVRGILRILIMPSDIPPHEDTGPRYFIENAKWELVPEARSSK